MRTAAFFGPWEQHNFVTQTLRASAKREEVEAASDTTVSPTYIVELVHATLDLLIDGAAGIWHLSNRGAVSWAELALAAVRPRYSALGSERGQLLPTLDEALTRHLRRRALAQSDMPADGAEDRRRNFRPWRYQQAGTWI